MVREKRVRNCLLFLEKFFNKKGLMYIYRQCIFERTATAFKMQMSAKKVYFTSQTVPGNNDK
jgi:hypothetical protein